VLEDLETACGQLLAGESVALGGRTWSYQRWGKELLTRVESGEHDAEVAYWQQQLAQTALPVDFAHGLNTVASSANVSVKLSVEQTRALLHDAGRAYHTEVQDLLLLALMRAVCEWSEQRSLSLWLEGHGREELFDKQDLTRTVGWFTTLFPVRLELRKEDVAEQIKSTKEQLRAIPNAGIGYGLLRYMHPQRELRERLSAASTELTFNYLGQLDNLRREGSLLRLSDESTGRSQSELGKRPTLLDVNAMVFDGCLHVDWTFSANVHRAQTIESVGRAFVSHLAALIEHCSSPVACGYTPSDFPLAELDQETLDSLVSGELEG
jgi:non-ribosomal peptide synthase protein (TIGR01720 family)